MNGERPEQAVEPRPWAGRYLLEQPLGEGGMAVVWQAWDRRLKAWRAIKILRSRYTQPTKTRHRFELEAQTMARLSHANIVTVHDIGEEDGQLFIVMEWLPGGSLQDRIQRDGPLTAQQTITAGISILSALQAAHEAGIVHRDVKPSNILLDAEGQSFLTDFGVARVGAVDSGLTRTGVAMGTLGFMAPEQREDARSADLRADIYAVGATLWSLLSGRAPLVFVAPESRAALEAAVPAPMVEIIWRATRYHPGDRYPDAETMRAALETVRHILPPDSPDTPTLASSADEPPPPPADTLRSWSSGSGSDATLPEETWAPDQHPFTINGEPGSTNTIVVPDTSADTDVESDTHVEPEPVRSPRWRTLVLIAVLLSVVGLAPMLSDLFEPPAETPPRPLTPIPPPDFGAVDEPEPEPEPEPEVTDGKPAEPSAAAEPQSPAPAPEAEPLLIEVAEVVTITERLPEPQLTPAMVIVEGDGEGARLVSADGKTYPPGAVPPGQYTFEILLPSRDRYVKKDLGELSAGSTITIRCADRFGMCNKL